MRINQYLAHATGCSRRQADELVAAGRVHINDRVVELGTEVGAADVVTLDGERLKLPTYQTIALNKPVGYITSRRQQSTTPTIYTLLPAGLSALKPVGRLDKDSSGLLILTNDGILAQRWQHPSAGKWKRYEVELDRALTPADCAQLLAGVKLADGLSRLQLTGRNRAWTVRLQEGRNRQIRRSFGALGYTVKRLHRTEFGSLTLGDLRGAAWRRLSHKELA